MAAAIDILLNLNDREARKVLADLQRRGQNLFGKGGSAKLAIDTVGFNRSLDQATSRILSFTATTTVLYSFGRALKSLTSDAIEVETAFSKIQSILRLTSGDLSKFESSIFAMANKVGVSFSDAATAAEEFSRQGLSVEKTLKATNAALALTRVSGGNVAKTVQDLNALVSSFGDEALVFEEVADVLGALDASFSTTTTGLAEGLSRVSATAVQAGVDFKTLASLIASTKQVTGRTEAVIGNAFKSIFSNLNTGAVQDEIEKIGVATKNADGSFRDADQVIKELAGSFEQLTDAQKNNLSLKVAGKYNRNTFEGALKAINSGVLDKALNVAEDATGSIESRLAVLNDTTETSITRLQNSIKELSGTNFGGMAKSFVDELLKFGNAGIDALKTLFEKENPIGNALSGGLLSILKGPALVTAGALLFKIIKKISIDLVNAGKNVLNNNKAFLTQRDILIQITRELQKQAGINVASNKSYAGSKAPIAGNLYTPPSGDFRSRFKAREQRVKDGAAATRAQETFVRPFPAQKVTSSELATINSGIGPRVPIYRDSINEERFARARRVNGKASTITPGNPFTGTSAFTRRAETDNRRLFAEKLKEKNLKAEKEAQKKQDRSGNIRNRAFATSFLAAGVGGALESSIGGSGGRIAGAAGEGVSYAALGVALGGLAAPVGIAIGAFKILGTVMEEMHGNFEEINKAATERVNELQKESEAADIFIQSQRALNDALKSGDNKLIVKAKKDLIDAGGNLTGDRKALSLLTDPDKQQALNSTLDDTSKRMQAAALATAESQKIVTESYKGFFNTLNQYLGNKKVIGKNDADSLGSSLAKTIDPDLVAGQLSGIAEKFNKTGDSGEIGTFIERSLTSPEAKAAFDQAAKEFEGNAEAVALATFQYLLANKAQRDLTKNQVALSRGTETLSKAFKNIITEAASQRQLRDDNKARGFETEFQKLSLVPIGDGADPVKAIEIQGQQERARIEAESSANLSKTQAELRKTVANYLLDNAQGEDARNAAVAFNEQLNNENFDFSNLESQLIKSLGATEGASALTGLNEAIRQFRNESLNELEITKNRIENARQLNEAQKKLAETEKLRSKFGNVETPVEEQRNTIQKSIEAISKGTGAQKLVQQGAFNLSGEQGQDFINRQKELKKLFPDFAKRNSGFKSEADLIDAGARAYIPLVNQARGITDSGIIGQTAKEAFGKTAAYNKSAGLVQNITPQEIDKFIVKLQDLISIGGFATPQGSKTLGARDLLAQQKGLNPEDRATIESEIDKAEKRFLEIGPTANALSQQAFEDPLAKIAESTRQTAENTGKALQEQSRIGSVSVQKLSNLKPIEDLQKSISSKQLEASSIDEKIKESVKTQGSLSQFLAQAEMPATRNLDGSLIYQSSPLQKKALQDEPIYSNSFSQIYQKFGDNNAAKDTGSYSNLGITEKEKTAISEAYTNFLTASERFKSLSEAIGKTRAMDLMASIDNFDPSISKTGTNPEALFSKKRNIENSIRSDEDKLNKLTSDQIAMQKAASDIKDGAASIAQSASALSQGSTQTVNANLTIKVERGGSTVENPDFLKELDASFRALFSKYTKEKDGKEPAFAPVTSTTGK